MVRRSTQDRILASLSDGKPKSSREIVRWTRLSETAVWNALHRYWKKGLVLRTREPIYEREKVFKGRGGMSGTMRPYHLYVLRPEGRDRVKLGGYEFVKYDKKHLDARGGGRRSKAQMILDFIKKNREKAFFSTEIAEALKNRGIKVCDVMASVRRFERRGVVYVRGYKSEDRQTPFREGYLITWIDADKPRERAIEEAVQKTNRALAGRSSTSPTIQRVHRARDIIIEHSTLRRLVSFPYIQNKLGCTEHEA